ncbi:MAG: pyridoxal-phosphate dependent enzyme [Candidatus Hydrogenedentota bacterium]|nr:MAG: pyridoxal-phosphate dependent enzyme [Candidatus Hydrogenedentota bacterium]
MKAIDLSIDEEFRKRAVERCRELGIIIPTFSQQRNPETVPAEIRERVRGCGLWDVNPLNLFRITWKNDPESGEFGKVNYLVFPESITGVSARIVGLVGKYFPTGAHKVGAAFGCLVPRLVTGHFDPTSHRAVWPSTGNYCRGGAFDSKLLGCQAVAILPEEMSRERFEWLEEIGAEVIATPGCESNVKEIYDKCWEIRKTRPDCIIFNQFDEFGNHLWHYGVTGEAILEVYEDLRNEHDRLSGFISATGSAGTIGAGDRLKEKHPQLKIAAAEALQCPTLLWNGFGGHRIEGIGDKHVPWIHNVRNTDMIIAVDDEITISLLRLFNEDEGKERLRKEGVPEAFVEALPLLGISGICNLVASIKFAKYYELGARDTVFTILTDSSDLYRSRLRELREERGEYSADDAAKDYARCLQGLGIDYQRELGYYDRKAIHNLKYYTWVEQQGKSVEELNELWREEFWGELHTLLPELDRLIEEFNRDVNAQSV